MGDDFLSRWSRRRQAVQDSEVLPPIEAAEPTPITSERPTAVPAAGIIDGPTPGETVPDEPLPSIEDLTADSDITGFLRRGVPEALKRAALRRAWSLDPAIRDFIGPAEYAWDYNMPGSMAGFGPAPAAGLLAAALTPGAAMPAKAVVEESAVDKATGLTAGGPPPGDKPGTDPTPAEVTVLAEVTVPAGGADPQDSSEPPEAASAPERDEHRKEAGPGPTTPRHGGALPR